MFEENYFPFATNSQLPTQKGFTLIEMLLVIAIIGILSAAILVGVSSQRDKARASRVLVELSGVIQPMMMCWADGGDVNVPSGGTKICVGEPGYGKWPDISSQGWEYNDKDLDGSGSWYLKAKKTGSGEYICCNSTYDRCANMGNDNSCNAGTVLP